MQDMGQYAWLQHAGIFLLIGWAVYRRVRRTIGFQLFSPRRLKFRIGIFSVLGLMILLLSFLHPVTLVGDAIGLAVGAVLVKYAIQHTVFEQRDHGWYYRTHVWIQTIVLALFLGRVVTRLLFGFNTVQTATSSTTPATADTFTRDPFTAAVFFVLVTYYVGYFIYVIRRGNKLKVESPTANTLSAN